jgi:putative protease
LVNDKQVQYAPSGSKAVIIIDGKRHRIDAGDRVFRVHNERLSEAARATIVGTNVKRVPIKITAHIETGEQVELSACVSGDPSEKVQVVSDFLAERGERRVLSEADVIAQLSRLGNTVYTVDSWDITVGPGVMVPLGKLNNLRRNLIEKLDVARLKKYGRSKVPVRKVREELLSEMEPETGIVYGQPLLTVDVYTTEQVRAAAKSGADWLYVRPDFSRSARIDLSELSSIASESGVKLALSTGNILHQHEVEDMVRFLESNLSYLDALLVDNVGLYHAVRDLNMPVFLDYHINNFNRLSSRFFRDSGASRICLSPELALDQIRGITGSVKVEFEAIIHGWLEVMTAEHCVPSAFKGSCQTCSSKNFYIEDLKGFRFPVEQDVKCRSHIYNSHELYLLPNVGELIKAGVSSLRLLLSQHGADDVGRITRVYREAIDLVTMGASDISPLLRKAEQIIPKAMNTTTGHFFRPVY